MVSIPVWKNRQAQTGKQKIQEPVCSCAGRGARTSYRHDEFPRGFGLQIAYTLRAEIQIPVQWWIKNKKNSVKIPWMLITLGSELFLFSFCYCCCFLYKYLFCDWPFNPFPFYLCCTYSTSPPDAIYFKCRKILKWKSKKKYSCIFTHIRSMNHNLTSIP